MKIKTKKIKRAVLVGVASLAVITIVAVLGCLVFLLDCYSADMDDIEGFRQGELKCYEENGNIIFSPENAEIGFIFYPGAKVDHRAYIPLLEACSEKGIFCAIVEMPLYFPLIDPDAADEIRNAHPEIKSWYIGGHSLGGYSASMHVCDNPEVYEGLILLASYSAADLVKTDIKVLTVYGDCDEVMNRQRYDAGLELLPKDYTEIVINGGYHSYFGMYYGQDGELENTPERVGQIDITSSAILEMMGIK